MITFKKLETKKYLIMNNEYEFLQLDLLSSSITNKFIIVTSFIEDVSRVLGVEFDRWFCTFLKTYVDNYENRYYLLLENKDRIIYFVDKYHEKMGFDYSKFVNHDKVKKNSIFFNEEDIETILKGSNYLKIYSIIFNSELKVSNSLHAKIYNSLVEKMMDSNLVSKLFNIVKTRTFRCNLTDKEMLTYIKKTVCKDSTTHTTDIFNFLMNNILILCENEKNPITFFVTVVDECLNWILRSVYKDDVIYNDSITTEDVQSINVNNLKAYCYNETLRKLESIAYNKIYKIVEMSLSIKDPSENKKIVDPVTLFDNRIEKIKIVSPVTSFLTFPIIAQLLTIPYKYFSVLNPASCIILSQYLHTLLVKLFGDKYKDLFCLLEYYPDTQPPVVTTYQLKNIDFYLNKRTELKVNFFGFNNKLILNDILANFIGKISRISFKETLTGESKKIPALSKIEEDAIEFYSLYFSGKLENEFEKLRKSMMLDF